MQGSSFTIHPEHVTLSFLISALVVPPQAELGWGLGFDGPTAQRLLALFLLEEIQDVSSPMLTPLPALVDRLEQQLGEAGSVLANALIGSLRGLRSPDDMLTVFQGFSNLLAPAGATPAVATDACSIAYIATSSPLGLFLRRVRLGLGILDIQGLATLTNNIQEQLQHLYTQRAAAAAGSDTAAAAAAAGGGNSSGTALKDQAVLEAYVNQLLAAVESQGQSLPASVVDAATACLSEQLNSTQDLPKLEYLRMAVSLAHKDMHAALASLHRYFDSSGSSSTFSTASSLGTAAPAGTAAAAAAGGSATAVGGSGSKGKDRHQAALHSMAALHANLGHPQEARAALQELLRLGQQQGDEWGLLHALAGLCRVMGMSEGLHTGLQPGHAGSSSSAAAAAGAGWGLLDLRRTEQQLQLQALLQRCLGTARDMRAPHIAAFAAVALCRFGQLHATAVGSGGEEGGEAVAAAAAAADTGGRSAGAATAATSVLVQRMLLDVATLEHQAAIAAAAPSTPAVAAAAAAAPGQPPAAALVARSTDLYNPTEAFGTGTSSTTPGSVSATAANHRVQPPGMGWKAAAAAVSQALATAHLAAAAALQLQGATSLAAVRLLMLFTGPGGAGAGLGTCTAAAAAAAAVNQVHGTGSGGSRGETQQAAATAAGGGMRHSKQLAVPHGWSTTGCAVRTDDIAAAWGLVVELVAQQQGVSAAQYALSLAQSHFPTVLPDQLAAAQQLLLHKAVLQCNDLPAARLACQELQCLAPLLPQLGLEVQLAAAQANALTHACSGSCQEAHSAAAALFALAASSSMQPQAVDALLLMGRACLQAGDLAGVLPYALSALLHCQQLQLDLKLPEAVLLLAGAWQGLAPGGSGFVLHMLQQVLPLGYACCGVKVQAELEEAVAKVMLHLVQEEVDELQRDRQAAASGDGSAVQQKSAAADVPNDVWQGIGQRLEAAAVMYEQAGCWGEAAGAWLLLAHVRHAAGQEEGRNAAAASWQAAKQQLLGDA